MAKKPTGPSVEFEVRGSRQAALDLRELGLRARDVRPVGRALQLIFLHGEQRRFATRAGGEWPELADSTVQNKLRQGQRTEVLRASDALYRSLTQMGASGQLKVIRQGEIRFGTTIDYAHFALGTVHEPARPPIGLRAVDMRAMTTVLSKHITRKRSE